MIGPRKSRLPDTLKRARQRFEDVRMRATCKITRPGDDLNEDDHGNVTPTETLVYEGKCYAHYPGLKFETNRESVGVRIAEYRAVVSIPFDPVIKEGDKVTIVADPDTPRLDGAVYQVATIDVQSQTTAQRLLCSGFHTGVNASGNEGGGEDG